MTTSSALRTPSVVIVNAYGRSNRGDSVLLDECILDIAAAMPNATITVALFEDEARHTFHASVVAKTERIGNSRSRTGWAKLAASFSLIAALTSAATGLRSIGRFLPEKQRRTLDAIFEADLVVSAPGGYIHDTNTALYVALAHIALPLLLKKRVFLAPQSIGPISGKFPKLISRWVLSRVEAICARESYTYQFLTGDLSLHSRQVRITGDSAFWNTNVSEDSTQVAQLWAQDFPAITGDERILGITVIGWSFPHHQDSAQLLKDYVNSIVKVIDTLCLQHGLRAVIFNQVSHDIKTAKLVQSLCRTPVVVQEAAREPEILRAYIARSTVFLGTRFHSCIFSMMASVPTFAIAYLPKTDNILKDLKLEKNAMPIDHMEPERIIDAISGFMANLEESKSALYHCLEQYRRDFANFHQVLLEIQKEKPF